MKAKICGINSLPEMTIALDAGADILVCGNSIFSAENPEETIAKLKAL